MQLVEQKFKLGSYFRLNKFRKLVQFSIFLGYTRWTVKIIKTNNIRRFMLFKFKQIKRKLNLLKYKENIWGQTRVLKLFVLRKNLLYNIWTRE